MSAVVQINGHTPHPSSAGTDASSLVPDIDEAVRFLTTLDPEADAFTFQLFGEGEARTLMQPRHLSGSFDALAAELASANVVGAGIFVTINETDLQGRATHNITRVRAVFADIDNDPDGAKRQAILTCTLAPHVVVESSPTKTHAYWLTDGLDRNDFRAVQRAVNTAFGGDLGVCDLARVMRLPGFLHCKHAPVQTRILGTTNAPPYAAAEIHAAFPTQLEPNPTEPARLPAPIEPPTESADAETIRDLRSALMSMRSDDRSLWIKMGCALRSLGDQGRGLWLDWSATSDAHRPAEDARTWDGLGHDRTTYRTVFAEAQRRGWINPRSSSFTADVQTSNVVAIDASALLTHAFPPREMFLAPWLQSQSLSMIYAWRGVGKTHVALGIAHALASGESFLGWDVSYPVPVLYIDGEMPGAALRDRLASTMSSSEKRAPPGYLNIVTPDLQKHGVMPNLATEEGQDAIQNVLGDARVIIVDNLSCLARVGKENEAEGWLPLAEWSLRMRATGHSVIFIHHAGKSGQQRGTSKREDLLDTVIVLKRPSDYRAEQGARFEVHFEKARALFGLDVMPIEASLDMQADRRQVWTTKPVEAVADARMIELAELGLSQAEVARELGCHRSTVLRALQKAEHDGRFTPDKHRKAKVPNKSPTASRPRIDDELRVAPPSPRNTQQSADVRNTKPQQQRNKRNKRNSA